MAQLYLCKVSIQESFFQVVNSVHFDTPGDVLHFGEAPEANPSNSGIHGMGQVQESWLHKLLWGKTLVPMGM